MYKSFLLLFIAMAIVIPTQFVSAQEATINPSGTVSDRLKKAISDQGLVVSDTTRATIQAKCQNAQIQLSDIQRTTEALVRKRIDIYSGLQKDLIAIQLRMVRQGSDASEVDLLTGKIQQGLDKFTITADAYGTSLSDTVAVNCVEKPEQFQAGLILLRTKRAQLLSAATELKNIMLSAPTNTYEPLKKRMVF